MPRTFKLLETLGEGAYGVVHLAEVRSDEGFVQTLAVKWLHPHCSHNADLAQRLRDEARLLGLLNHDHIVRVHGLTRLSGRLAILMEPVEGADLSRVQGAALPPRAALEVVEIVAEALDAAWQTVPPGQEGPLRVVHRDIKPSNIMVTARGSVKVMDFGVARATFDSREAATRSQQYGTARYMAPERWLEGVAGAPSDVFSLGVTLIELLGAVDVERPRLSKEGFRADIEAALSALDPWPAVRELAEQMCAYDPEARPTAAEVAERCRSLEHDQPAPGLREWAAGWVPTADHRPAPDPRDGSVVCEDTGSTTYDFSSADTADLDASASSFAPTERVSGTVARFRSRRLAFIGGFVAAACLAVGLTVLRPAADPERASVDEGSPDPIATMEPGPTTTEVPARGGDAADEPPEPVDMPTATPVEPVATRPEPAQPVTTRPEPAQPAGGAVPPTEAGARTVEPDPKASPTPAPPAEDPPPTSYVTFIVRPPDLKVSAHGQAIHSRRAVELPLGVHEVSVTDGASQWTCTVVVDDVPRTWRIEGAKRQCTQAS